MELGISIFRNVCASIIEKIIILLGQFISTFLIIRLLPREQYGFIGLAVGLFAFVNFINIALESIVYRDHGEFKKNISFYTRHFVWFAIFKVVVFFLITLLLNIWGIYRYNSFDLMFAVSSVFLIFSTDALSSPFAVYATSILKQSVVTRVTFLKNTLSIFLILGLIFFPSIKYIFIKDLIVSCVSVGLWLFIAKSRLGMDLKSLFKIRLYKKFIIKSMLGYSIWTHFIGVVTGFIYKADTFFLALFVDMTIVGNYNVALNSANVANLLPSILGQQNSIALSNLHDDKKKYEITCMFLRFSVYAGALTLLSFVIFAPYVLRIITGEQDVSSIYFFLMCIVGGLIIVKSVASPLVSFINIYGDVKSLFYKVNLPMFIISSMTYFGGAWKWQAIGVAWANIINSLLWSFLVFVEMRKYNFNYLEMFKIYKDFEIVAKLVRRLRYVDENS